MADADYDALFEAAGRRYNVDPALLRAIGQQESGLNADAVGPETAYGRARGPMQLIPATAKALGVTDPHDPAQAVDGAARLLSDNLDQFGNVEDAIAAYHGGPNTAIWGPKTRAYRQEVSQRYLGGSQSPGAPAMDEWEALAFGDAPPSPGAVATSPDAAPDQTEWESLAFGGGAPSPHTPAPSGPARTFEDTGARVTPQQQASLDQLQAADGLDYGRPAGDIRHPFVARPDRPTPSQHGDWYVDLDGSVKQFTTETGAKAQADVERGLAREDETVFRPLFNGFLPKDEGERSQDQSRALLQGYSWGGADEAAAAGRFLTTGARNLLGVGPGYSAREAYGARLRGERDQRDAYEAEHPFENIGLQLGGGALNPLTYSGGKFIAGSEGGMAPQLAVMSNRLLPTAARGAVVGTGTGAVAGALMAEPGDRLEGAAQGAAFGGFLGAAAPAVERGAGVTLRALRGKNKLTVSAAPLAEQEATFSAARGLPVPVPLTQGQISRAPAQQMLENAMLRGSEGDAAARIMQEGAGATQEALRGNVDAIRAGISPRQVERGSGAAMASERLNTLFDAAKAGVDQAYRSAREASDGAFIPASERPVIGSRLAESIKDFDPETIGDVKRVLSAFDGSPTADPLSPRELFEARSRLGVIRADGTRPQSASAAARATNELDAYIDDALASDLISGNENVVASWRNAIGKRRDFGKLFEGDDLIERLTTRDARGGEGRALSVAPEDAANYIFGRSDLGFVGKRDLKRDMGRLRKVLGPDSEEWNALRAEAFSRFARAGEGPPEGGQPQFSGQKFMKAWRSANTADPEIMRTLFTQEERDLIDRFAEIAQVATTPVRGGDNPSNTAIAAKVLIKKAMDSFGTIAGGATGSLVGPVGAGIGAGIGRAFDALLKDVGAVVKARKAVSGVPLVPKAQNRLITGPLVPIGAAQGSRLLGAPERPGMVEVAP